MSSLWLGRLLKRLGSSVLVLVLFAGMVQAAKMAMTIEWADDSGTPTRLTIKTDLEHEAWLGVSWYAAGITDAYAEGEHQIIHLAQGKSEQSFKVPQRLIGGSVECALWRTKVFRKDCEEKCQWCTDNGFHLENRQAYLFGSLLEAK